MNRRSFVGRLLGGIAAAALVPFTGGIVRSAPITEVCVKARGESTQWLWIELRGGTWRALEDSKPFPHDPPCS